MSRGKKVVYDRRSQEEIKVRLDLTTKEQLKEVCRTEGKSMQLLIEGLIKEHIFKTHIGEKK